MATTEELVVQFRAETDQMRREMAAMQRQLDEFTRATHNTSIHYQSSLENMGDSTSEYSRRLRQLKAEQRAAMKPHIEELKRTKLAYLDAAMSMGTYTGSAQDLIAQVNEIGKAEKAANDEIMKLDRMKQASILQTIGMLNNMSTTSSKLQGNLQRMGNPLYNVSRGALAATNAMERLANRSSAAQLALEFLGPNANMKELNDQIRIINQSVMGMGQAFLVVGAGAVMFYGKLHKANMEMNPKYAKAYKDMMESLTEALQPMRDAFAALMIPIFNFVNAMAKLIIAFNKAHPTLAKFIQGTMMLVPALTLLLLPLGAGMGLLMGYRAAFAALWMIIKPVVLVLAMASPVAWALAAAITGLAVGFSYAYKNIEPFRNAVNKTVHAIKVFGQALVDLSKYLFWTAVDGDYMNDWITHLPKGFQDAALKIGESVAMIRDKVIGAMGVVSKFGEVIAALGKYLFYTALDGDYFNDWITHLPAGFQDAVLVIGKAVSQMRDLMVSFVSAIKAAFQGDFSQIINFFVNLIPNIIAILIGGIPGLLLTITTLFVRMSDGAAAGGATLLTKFQEILNLVITSVITFITTQLPQFIQKGIEILTSLITGIVQALPQVIQAASTIILTLVNGIAVLLPTLLNIGIQLIQTIITGIIQLLPAIIESGSKILFALIDGIVSLIPTLIDVAMQIIQTILDTLVKLLPTLLEMGMKILVMLIQGIVDMLPKIIDVAIKVIVQLIDTFVKLLPKIIEMGIQLIIALIDGIVKMLPQIINTVVILIKKFTEVIIRNLPVIIKAGIQILLALIEGIIKVLPQIGGAIIEIIKAITMILIENLPTLIRLGAQLILALIDGFFTVMGELWRAINGKILPSIWEAFQGVDWSQVGKNIIIGLINGLGSLAYKAVMAAYDIGKSIFKTITGFFDIHSPSRLMRGVGEYVIMGMIKGLNNMENPAVKAAKDVATSVKDAFDVLSDDISLGDVAFAGSIPGVSTSYSAPASVSSTTSSSFGQQAMVNSQSTNSSNQNDGSLVASAIAGLRKDLTNLQVVMEGETVGRIVRPHVNEGNAVENTVRRYF
ncbi:carbamoyl-phosphate synthase [Bacillus tropicus]|uniref:carbamoyl-phosphate synthase n=1 Tax=Bacillus tropicus TaxID=2026188 RepID=UPI00214B5BE6|nr:carbamoyl-phosphate synthase [Bacillus tropicus]